MRPIETTKLALEFAGPLSPGWLILLAPLVMLLGWRLYKTQFKGVAPAHAAGLLVLRLLLLAGVVFLMLRPSLVRRRVLTYPGRVLLVLDDSESMAARDNAMAPAKALYLARRLWPSEADVRNHHHELALTLSEATSRLHRFEALSRTADRTKDAFWAEAEKAQDAVTRKLLRIDELAGQAPSAGETGRQRLEMARGRARTLRQALPALFTGDRHPGAKAFERFYAEAAQLHEEFLSIQAALDAEGLAAGSAALTTMLEGVRSRPRLELLGAELARELPSLPSLVPGQTLQVVRLMGGEVSAPGRFKPQDLKAASGETDIVGRLSALAEERSDFPLTAIVLFSDGRDLGPGSPAALKQALARKAIPLYAAGVGDTKEPLDAAMLQAVAPPFAVKGAPLRVKAHVKASLPEPREMTLEVLKDGQRVASSKHTLGAREEQWVSADFTPAELGLFRYTVRLESLPVEAFPAENNAADFVVQVRPDKVKVLLLDWKPRWETRFALNILRRLDYVELNPIIVLTQEGATLRRGAERGTWPDTQSALDTYDLVVLGDLPPDTLSAAECEALSAFVQEKGKAVCFLAPGLSVSTGPLGALLPAGVSSVPASADGARQVLRVTDAGGLHPTTRLLREMEGAGEAEAPEPAARGEAEAVLPDAQVLLVQEDGRPVVTCRLVGSGRTFLVGPDDLWRTLNPTRLSAHGQLYVELVTWAVQGGFASGAQAKAARLAVDGRVFDPKKGFQVWLYPQGAEPPAGEAAAPVVQVFQAQADTGIPALAESPAVPAHDGAAVHRAAFPRLPRPADAPLPESVVFALKDKPGVTTEPVLILDDRDELKRLSQHRDFLEDLAAGTGGAYRELADFEDLFSLIEPKVRTEKHDSTWRLWDSAVVLAFLTGVLTLEWVWRKLVGLI